MDCIRLNVLGRHVYNGIDIISPIRGTASDLRQLQHTAIKQSEKKSKIHNYINQCVRNFLLL